MDRGALKVSASEVSGTTADGLKFPAAVMGTGNEYTLFYVAKYNGASKGRIFDGTSNNWLSGFWTAKVGVAYHDSWMTQSSTSIHPADQYIQGTDSIGVFRTNGVDRVTVFGNTRTTGQITINSGFGTSRNEASEWAVKEVIIYNLKLLEADILKIEEYLHSMYFDECADAPCLNGGTCTNAVTGFTCSCVSGYSGDTCANIDDCVNNNCQSYEVCVDGIDSFTCYCPAGYTGSGCQTGPIFFLIFF